MTYNAVHAHSLGYKQRRASLKAGRVYIVAILVPPSAAPPPSSTLTSPPFVRSLLALIADQQIMWRIYPYAAPEQDPARQMPAF